MFGWLLFENRTSYSNMIKIKVLAKDLKFMCINFHGRKYHGYWEISVLNFLVDQPSYWFIIHFNSILKQLLRAHYWSWNISRVNQKHHFIALIFHEVSLSEKVIKNDWYCLSTYDHKTIFLWNLQYDLQLCERETLLGFQADLIIGMVYKSI